MKFFFPLLMLFLGSCSAPKDFTFRNRMVSERSWDRKVKRITRRYVRHTSPEMIRLMLNLEVVYDTTQTNGNH